MSGFGFWSHDIGGFEGRPDPAVFKRWIPFGLLCTHSRLHGSDSYRVPWLFDEESVEVLRRFTRLKAQLMPYIYGQAVVAARDGMPVLRPMVAEFPDDPAAPISIGSTCSVIGCWSRPCSVRPARRRTTSAGTWTHLQTGATVRGPAWVHDVCDFQTVPVFVRPGSVLPIGSREDRRMREEDITLRVYEFADGGRSTLTVPGAGEVAAAFEVARDGRTLTATRPRGAARWRLLVMGQPEISVPADTDQCSIEM